MRTTPQGRPEEARWLPREVIASHPGHLFACYNLARTLIVEGASDEAEALLDSAKGDEDRTPRNPCWRVWSR